MTPRAEPPPVPPAVRVHLDPGESVRWTGKPRQTEGARDPRRTGLGAIRAGGIVLVAALGVLVLRGAPAEAWWRNLPGLAILLAALLAGGGVVVWTLANARRDLRARTTFVLTDRRAFAQEDGTGEGPSVWTLSTETPPVLCADGTEDWALLFRHRELEGGGRIAGHGFTGLPRDPDLRPVFARLGVLDRTDLTLDPTADVAAGPSDSGLRSATESG